MYLPLLMSSKVPEKVRQGYAGGVYRPRDDILVQTRTYLPVRECGRKIIPVPAKTRLEISTYISLSDMGASSAVLLVTILVKRFRRPESRPYLEI